MNKSTLVCGYLHSGPGRCASLRKLNARLLQAFYRATSTFPQQYFYEYSVRSPHKPTALKNTGLNRNDRRRYQKRWPVAKPWHNMHACMRYAGEHGHPTRRSHELRPRNNHQTREHTRTAPPSGHGVWTTASNRHPFSRSKDTAASINPVDPITRQFYRPVP